MNSPSSMQSHLFSCFCYFEDKTCLSKPQVLCGHKTIQKYVDTWGRRGEEGGEEGRRGEGRGEEERRGRRGGGEGREKRREEERGGQGRERRTGKGEEDREGRGGQGRERRTGKGEEDREGRGVKVEMQFVISVNHVRTVSKTI